MLEGFECLRLHAYDDHDGKSITWNGREWRRMCDGSLIMGFPTIGFGRCLQPGEIIETCTREQADTWLSLRLMGTDLPQVDKLLPEANPHQRGAATMFSYNCGTGGLAASGIGAAHVAGDLVALKAAWMARRFSSSKGAYLPGLAKRRAQELAYYLTPVPLTDEERAGILASVYATSRIILDELT